MPQRDRIAGQYQNGTSEQYLGRVLREYNRNKNREIGGKCTCLSAFYYMTDEKEI